MRRVGVVAALGAGLKGRGDLDLLCHAGWMEGKGHSVALTHTHVPRPPDSSSTRTTRHVYNHTCEWRRLRHDGVALRARRPAVLLPMHKVRLPYPYPMPPPPTPTPSSLAVGRRVSH